MNHVTDKVNSKREEIITAVIKLSQQSDFRNMSIRKICDYAEIAIGTFYYYFPSKEVLLNAVLQKIDPFLMETVVPRLTDEDEANNLHIYAEAFAQDSITNGSLRGGIVSNSFIPLPSTEKEIEAEADRPLYAIPRDIIRRGQKKGQFSTKFSADNLTNKLITILRGVTMEWSRRNYSFDILEYTREIIEMFLEIIRIKQPAGDKL